MSSLPVVMSTSPETDTAVPPPITPKVFVSIPVLNVPGPFTVRVPAPPGAAPIPTPPVTCKLPFIWVFWGVPPEPTVKPLPTPDDPITTGASENIPVVGTPPNVPIVKVVAIPVPAFPWIITGCPLSIPPWISSKSF